MSMYRYGQPSRSASATKTQQTILLLILLALVIVCVGLAIVYSSASRANNSTQRVLVSQMQIEVSAARTRAGQLLPPGGSSLVSVMATVRQHIHSARTVNEMAGKIYGLGNELVNATLITNCIELLDQCEREMQTGAVVTGTFSQLSEAIDLLFSQVSMLE